MADFFNSIKKLFSFTEEPKAKVLHEMIERSEAEQEAYETWKGSRRFDRIMDYFKERLGSDTGSKVEVGYPLHFLETPSMNGFVIEYDSLAFSDMDFQHYFDYLKEQVLLHGYKSYMSDVKTNLVEDKVEVRERHYLKPKFAMDDTERSNQLYGNITIEHDKVNDEPVRIKFVATAYTDHKFSKALHSNELLLKMIG